MKWPDNVDIIAFIGLVLVAAGLYGFDWRLSLIVAGSILLVFAAYVLTRSKND